MSSEHLLVENFNLGNDENREHPPLPAHSTEHNSIHPETTLIINKQTDRHTAAQPHTQRTWEKDREFRKQMTQKIYAL